MQKAREEGRRTWANAMDLSCSPEIGIGILGSVYSLDNTVLGPRREMYCRREFTYASRRISSRLSFRFIFSKRREYVFFT